MKGIFGSRNISSLILLPDRDAARVFPNGNKGIFIGSLASHNLPFMFDVDELMNPHIFIAGITGSGKTYFLRSLILKLNSNLNCSILILDFTGEYTDFDTYASSKNRDGIVRSFLEGRSTISKLDLKGSSEKERILVAERLISEIAEEMRYLPVDYSERKFIVLDEAWKILERSRSVETIIREGRKYGIGIIFASQSIDDSDQKLTSNVASMFLFRQPDEKSLHRLAKDYGMVESDIKSVQNLELGSCFGIFLLKSKERMKVLIKKTSIAKVEKRAKIRTKSNNFIEVDRNRLSSVIGEFCGPSVATKLSENLFEMDSIELQVLIRILIQENSNSYAILKSIRKLGFEEDAIADAFSSALAQLSVTYEK